ncbi:galactose mutarotase-like domain-containing protein [Baffinella frigidus]|nr:galactose mutarotase-like domain-containing protein [Cryptophyta sp. CCMP2293]
MTLTLPKELTNLAYFGHGPHESYTDRKLGAPLGAYETTVDETFVPYLAPSENGARAGVRWCALTNAAGKGLLVSPACNGETFLFSAHRFTPHDLHKATHPHEVPLRDEVTLCVPLRDEVTLCVDHQHMPCGGNDSWSRSQLDQYLIKSGTHTYSIRLSPVSPGSIGRPQKPPGNITGPFR